MNGRRGGNEKRGDEPNFERNDKSAELKALEGKAHDSRIENEEIGDSEKKKKKRKKERARDGENESSKKKKHKTENTDLPNPDEDPSLTDQARKGEPRAYIYTYWTSHILTTLLPQPSDTHTHNSMIRLVGNLTKLDKIGS